LLNKGWLNTHELQYARRGRRDWLIGQVAHQIIGLARAKEKGIVIEGLKFKRSEGDGRRVNRIFNQFTFRRLANAVVRVGKRQGVLVKQVNPAFTSVIGDLKYQKVYPHLAIHEAAAYVIARRGLGFIDMPVGPQRMQAEESLEERLGKQKLHHWAYWRSLKRAANSGNGKPPGTTGEPEQGDAPTRSASGTPAPYRGKGTGGNQQKGDGSSMSPVQPGSPASREGCVQTL